MPTHDDDRAVATFSWTITPERHARVFDLVLAGRTKMLRRAHWLVPLLGLIAALNAWIVLDGGETRGVRLRLGLYAAVAFGAAAIALLTARFTSRRTMQRSWRSIESCAGDTVTLSLTESGLVHDGPRSTGTIAWAAIQDAKVLDGGLLLGLGGESIVLTDDDFERVDSRLGRDALVDWIVARVDEHRSRE